MTFPVASYSNNYAWPNPQAAAGIRASDQPVWANGSPTPANSHFSQKANNAVQPEQPSETEKTQETGKQPSALAKAWKQIILFAPLLGFIGSSTLITKSLPNSVKSGIVNGALKTMKRSPLPAEAIDSGLKTAGQKFLGFAVLLKSLGGISAGIVSGQPSMIWGNLIQILPAGILAFKKSNAMQNFATSMEMLLGGFYTVGFANELKNKDPKTSPDQIRRYDMTRLKSLFNWGNGMTMGERFKGLLGSMGSMAAFTIQDHVLLVKDLGHKAIQSLRKLGKPSEQETTFKEKMEKWTKEPSASKSQVAALFFYLGTLPILLMTRKNPKIGEKFHIVALKFIGMTIANLAPFAIALNRDDLRGKAPLIGAPMAVLGMANSRNPFFVGMGHLGESFNDLFFSDVAVNGVKTKSDPAPTASK